jgi:hypothetical protein
MRFETALAGEGIRNIRCLINNGWLAASALSNGDDQGALS